MDREVKIGWDQEGLVFEVHCSERMGLDCILFNLVLNLPVLLLLPPRDSSKP